MASKRSQEVKFFKDALNRHGHQMGNAVNCAPLPDTDLTLSIRCRKCGKKVYIIRNNGGWGTQGDDLQPCPWDDATLQNFHRELDALTVHPR